MGHCGLDLLCLSMNGQEIPYYVGSFRHRLDAKNRLTIPSKWRFAGDDGDVYLALPDPGGYITVLPPLEVEKLYERVSQKLLSDGTAQAFLSKFFSQAHTFGCDKQGRVGLATALLAHAGIEKATILVGTMSKFAIWSPDRWRPVDPQASGEDLGGSMKEVGL